MNMHTVMCLIVAALCVMMCVRAGAQEALTIHIAPDGNDAWSGRLPEANAAGTDGPLRTILSARQAVREVRADGWEGPVRVILRGGVYEVAEPLTFTRADGGTEAGPVAYEAAEGEEVVLRGGRAVSGWRPWRDGIFQADLRAQGLEDAFFHQLFFRGKRQVVARHPNRDPQRPRTGGFIYVEARGPVAAEQFVYEEGTIPFDEWEDISQAQVWTVFGLGWNFALTPVLDVDTARRIITTPRVRRPYEPLNRFFIQNVLGALDEPGEWFHDRKTGMLYFRPPEGEVADGEVVVPVVDDIIRVVGALPYPHGYLNVAYKGAREDFPPDPDAPAEAPVEHLTFRGLRLEVARQSGISLRGAAHCRVEGCSVTNVGGVGINLGAVANAHEEVGNPHLEPPEGYSGGVGGGGQNVLFNDPCRNCVVTGNDVRSVGADGIFLYGTGNVADNNHVYDTGLFDKDSAGINLWGEGNVARRNAVHDVPRNAVFLKGIGNIVELNEIRHTMLETCDGGAVRMCQRNLHLRGNVIRHNRIVDTTGYGYVRGGRKFLSPYYSWGVYLDDFTCGTTVEGNLIVRTGRGGVMLHGGSDNVVVNNIIVDAGAYQVEVAPIGDSPMTGNRVERNVIVCSGEAAPYGTARPYRCTRWVEDCVRFAGNVVWTRGEPTIVDLGAGGGLFDDWAQWLERGLDEGSVVADPLLADPEGGDYRPGPDSPAWGLGFDALSPAEVGCYEAAERASWPLEVAEDLVREEPVLYERPARPVREDFEVDLAGRPPRHGDVLAAPRAPIVVTDEKAATGRQSLKFVDAPGLPQPWMPRLYYQVDYEAGAVCISCDLLLDGEKPPRLYLDPRQYSDSQQREYLSGPMLTINPDGALVAAGNVIARLPFDRWFTIRLETLLGEGATGASELTLTVHGEAPERFTVPHVHEGFRRLERVVIAATGEEEAVFYLDNVYIGPGE